MTCRHYRRIMDRVLNRDCTERESRALAIHLTWCGRCAARRDGAALAAEGIRASAGPVPRVEVVSRIMARVHQALPELVRRDRISPPQFAWSVGIATAVAAGLVGALLWLAPEAVRSLPVDRIAYWGPRILADGSRMVLETIEFLTLTVAQTLRLANAIGNEWPFLGPLRILLITTLTAIGLGTTTILVRRDLARSRPGIR